LERSKICRRNTPSKPGQADSLRGTFFISYAWYGAFGYDPLPYRFGYFPELYRAAILTARHESERRSVQPVLMMRTHPTRENRPGALVCRNDDQGRLAQKTLVNSLNKEEFGEYLAN
jgi:hypothetical protein